MNEALEILKYTLPAFLVLLALIVTLWMMFRYEEKRRKAEIINNYKDNTLPLRLQAFERMVLFLERISPDSLVMRVTRTDCTSAQMQSELINAIRTEYEHNIAQQVYLSSKAWEMIKAARNNVIKLINESASELKPEAAGMSLSKKLLEKTMELNSSPVEAAVEFLKKEIRELF